MNYLCFFVFVTCNILLMSRVYCDTQCPTYLHESTVLCTNLPYGVTWTRENCESADCCWIDGSASSCYQKECTPGYFGSYCQFQCSCNDELVCDRVTGECENSVCSDDSWGVGCMLDNACTYNDDIGLHYTGKLDKADGNISCIPWTRMTWYKLEDFADKDNKYIEDLSQLNSYCRNPSRNPRERAFCLINRRRGDSRRTEYCPLRNCSCPAGRFGVNCARECHCMNPDEQCNPLSGECVSECHPSWTGLGCQQCSEGWFGGYCHQRCHCQDVEESCDNVTGVCLSGCAAGWTGFNCQAACPRGFFGIGCELQCRCGSSMEICNRVNGSCPLSGCKTGYAGVGCQIMLPTMIHVPTITTRTATSLTVNWRDWRAGPERGSGPVTGYILFYKLIDSTQWLTTLPNITRPFTVSGLSSNQQYYVKVAAVHQSGAIGSPSPNVSVKTCGRPLSGPTSIKLTPVETARDESGVPDDEEEEIPEWTEPSDNTYDTTSLSVVWKLPVLRQINCVSQLQSRIYTRRPEDDDFVLVANVSSGGLRTQLTDINPYVNLTVAVTIVNNAWLESDMINDTYVGRSGPVEVLKASAISPNILVISWSPPTISNGIINYYLLSYRQLSHGGCPETSSEWSRLARIMPNETETTLMDLSPFSTYEVKVIVRTSAGRGQVALANGTTDSMEPPSVAGLYLVNITATAARFVWTPLDCEMYNGKFVGYEFELTDLGRDDTDEIRIIANDIIVRAEKYFPNLIPFTNYSFTLFFRNEKFPGAKSIFEFATLEDVPPPPRNFSLQSKLSNGLNIVWSRPQPPNGILTHYTVRYRQTGVADYTVTELDASLHGYNITGLNPFTNYVLQVQATTRAGSGAWSEQLECTTEESIPSEPLNFVNSSRTSTSATFHWLPPLRPNGLLRSFEIVCTPTNRNLPTSVVFNHTVSSTLQEFTITKLLPGLCYLCTLRAVNGKGNGPMATRLFWTEPVLSEMVVGLKIDNSKVADTTVTMVLTPPIIPDSMEEADKIYRIVVQTNPVFRKRRLSPKVKFDEPCGLSSHELVDIKTAGKLGLACYVAAEIVLVSDGDLFIIGDGKTYGGYFNAPLKPDYNYRIWFGLVVAVDGASASSYSFVDKIRPASPPAAPEPTPKSEPITNAGSVIGIVVAVILILVIAAAAVVGFLFWKRRRNHRTNGVVSNIYVEGPGTATKLYTTTDDGDSVSGEEMTPFILEPQIPKPQTTSRPIPVSDLWSFVATKKIATDGGLKTEYLSIPSKLAFNADFAKKSENKLSNRYGNIIAYDHSRVILECSNSTESDYINANFIDGFSKHQAYVSTQGPSKITLNDFWRMVWQLKSSRIVMLCNLVEDGRRKCEQYWPDTGVKSYGEINVESIDVETFADFKIRKFLISKRGDSLTVMHFHFTAWPDHGVPTQPTSLLSFRRKFHSYDTGSVSGPVVVHCSAGVGRSGTFISLDYLLDQAKSEGKVDVLGCVYKLRDARVNMVQTPDQYVLIYDSLLEALATGDTAIPCNEFRQRYAYLQEVNPATGKLRCLEEFESLESVSSQSSASNGKLDGLSPENIGKNRSKDIVPPNRMCRPLLLTCSPGSTDYINAVFVDGYKQRDAFIVTQMPMPHTIIDFWTMIHDHSCRTIIMLNDLNSTDKNVGVYFPVDLGRQTYGQFIVELVSVNDKSNPSIIVRDFNFSLADQAGAPKTIRHFQFMAWPSSSSIPTSKSAMLSLLNLLEQWQQRSDNGVITIHCMDGVNRSGLLCSLSYLLERLKAEQDVDVFHSVKHARVNRPQLVPTFDQYQFLCDMAIEYLDCFETYSNFK